MAAKSGEVKTLLLSAVPVFNFTTGKLSGFRKRFRAFDVFLLDDLDFLAGKKAAEEFTVHGGAWYRDHDVEFHPGTGVDGIDRAAGEGATLVCLPEITLLRYPADTPAGPNPGDTHSSASTFRPVKPAMCTCGFSTPPRSMFRCA